MTPRNFNAAELDEMQVDWQRTHNVKIVAELHGCTWVVLKKLTPKLPRGSASTTRPWFRWNFTKASCRCLQQAGIRINTFK